MRTVNKRKGFTLTEVVITIAVIAILAVGIVIGADEMVTSAKATKIINNLYTLKQALWSWYADNSQNVAQRDGNFKGLSVKAGMVIIDNVAKPIQEWGDDKLQLSKYLSHMEGGTGINFNKKYTFQTPDGKNQTNTDLAKGYYGICDGGGDVGKRYEWYAGYRFKDGEDKVREKIKGRIEAQGLAYLGTADAHPDPNGDNSQAIWLRVR